MTDDHDKIKRINDNLELADRHLQAAIGELGTITGSSMNWIGSWGDYKRLVAVYVKLQKPLTVSRRILTFARFRNKND